MTAPIPLAEQIAAVERAVARQREIHILFIANDAPTLGALAGMDADRLAAALATLRGLLLIEETR